MPDHRLEKHLVTLRKQQKEKVEEIKKKTNYDSTRNLIERYDETTDSPLRRRVNVNGASVPATPQKAPTPQPQRMLNPLPRSPAQIPPALQQQLFRRFFSPSIGQFSMYLFSASPQRPMPPPRKHWYDKVADAILGDDDTITAASSRFALICQRCFAHNGLVKESVWEETRTSPIFFCSLLTSKRFL